MSAIIQSVAGRLTTSKLSLGAPTVAGNLIAVYVWHAYTPNNRGGYSVTDTAGNHYTSPAAGSNLLICHNALSMQTLEVTRYTYGLIAEIDITTDHIPRIDYTVSTTTPTTSHKAVKTLRTPRPPKMGLGIILAEALYTSFTMTGPTLDVSVLLSFTYGGEVNGSRYYATRAIFTSSAQLTTYRIKASGPNNTGSGSGIQMTFYPLGLTGGWSETSWQSSWAMR